MHSILMRPERLESGCYRLCFSDMTMEVAPKLGGRIVSFKCRGSELLTQPGEHAQNYGSTFWDAPQSAWGWPPRAVLDSLPYRAVLDGEALVLSSAVDPASGLRFVKRFAVQASDGAFLITYRMSNHGRQVHELAPWEVTRVPGSLSFYACCDDGALPESALPVIHSGDGMAWYLFDAAQLAVGRKHFGAAAEGWLAHVTPARVLFVKQFDSIRTRQCARGHAPVEIWGQDGGPYIELENHGVCAPLVPGSSVEYVVRWRAQALPDYVDVRVGNPALVVRARAMLLGGR